MGLVIESLQIDQVFTQQLQHTVQMCLGQIVASFAHAACQFACCVPFGQVDAELPFQ